jgi:apolipoprotein N-acyltransferase
MMLLIKKISNTLKPNRASFYIFLCGLSSIFLFAPFHVFLLGFIIFPYLGIKIFESKNFKENFNLLFYFYLGFYFGNYYWISFSFLVNKNYSIFFPIIFIVIPLYFSLFSSLFLSLIFIIKNKFKLNIKSFYLCFSLLLCVHEVFRGNILPLIDFKGLPWNLLGYSLSISDNLIQITSIIGIYGLTFITIYLYSSAIFIFYKKNMKYSLLIFMLNFIIIASLYIYGKNRIENNETKKITDNKFQLIHTNIIDHHNYDNNKIINNIDNLVNIILKEAVPNSIIILPEGSIPVVTESLNDTTIYNPAITYMLNNLPNLNFKYLITSSITLREKDDVIAHYNSIHNISYKREFESSYDKINLVPFGEYIPYLSILPRIATQTNFFPGTNSTPLTLNINKKNTISYIALICYDAIFSGKMSKEGDFLLNISNDIWFTKKIKQRNISLGSWQHFDQVRFRAIEEGKPLIRITNYGVTAVVNSFGEVITKLDFNSKKNAITTNLPPKSTNPTFFNQYRHFIAWVFIIINLITFIIIIIAKTPPLLNKNQ